MKKASKSKRVPLSKQVIWRKKDRDEAVKLIRSLPRREDVNV